MADQARSLHTQELHHAGDGAGHPLTKKQRLPSQLEHELQQAADGEETGLSHDSNSADQQANQHEVLTETAQAGFHMLESRVTTTDAKVPYTSPWCQWHSNAVQSCCLKPDAHILCNSGRSLLQQCVAKAGLN